MPWGLTPAHLIIVLVIVLIVVGPGKLPDTGAAIGKALRGFKDSMEGTEPGQTPTPAAPVAPAQPAQPVQYVQVQQPPVQYVNAQGQTVQYVNAQGQPIQVVQVPAQPGVAPAAEPAPQAPVVEPPKS